MNKILKLVVWGITFLLAMTAETLGCNMNVGAYKLHNGQGEMSYMDREKSNLYSEQGVWVSWKVPVPRHWDPKTGLMRNEAPGRVIGDNWSHWNQLSDDNPPIGKPNENLKGSTSNVYNERINAPDPYREYLRARQRQPSVSNGNDDDLYFLSAGHSPEQGTSLEVGVIRGIQRPTMPAVYLGAMRRPSFNMNPDGNEDEGVANPNRRPVENIQPRPTISNFEETPAMKPIIAEKPRPIATLAPNVDSPTMETGLLMEQAAGSGDSFRVSARSAAKVSRSGKFFMFE